MIGRTGVYELDEEINITNLRFIRPKKYILDEDKTKQNLEEGKNGLEAAEAQRAISLNALNVEKETKEEEALQALNDIFAALDSQLAEGLLTNEEYYEQKELAQLEYNETIEANETAYWNKYIVIQTEYDAAYEEALSKYNIGLNGIYVLPNPDNVYADENYEILYNIIIDFLY